MSQPTMHPDDVFPARLKALREKRGFSLRGLEAETGIARNTINRYEQGRRCPTLPALRTLALALEVKGWTSLLGSLEGLRR